MAINQVSARIEGDVYQGMYFWYQASSLFIENKKADYVIFEHDAASGVDDICVYYNPPGVLDAGRYSSADFYQVKYHVDNRDSYDSDNLIKPSFIKAKSSLLQHFYSAYLKLKDTCQWFRLYLISNWRWNSDDVLVKSIRECDYSLPPEFFSNSSRSVLGSIREKWREHLGINESIFKDFAERLRFGFNYFGRGHFQETLYDRLGCVGLMIPQADSRICPYNSLYQRFIMDRINKFTRTDLLKICKEEGLLLEDMPLRNYVSVIGIRSFMRFAERIEDETSRFVCVAENFNGRYIRDLSLWRTKVVPDVCRFLNNSELRRGENHLLLDCHSSLAFLAGYELDQKSGANVYPIQKGIKTVAWKPSGDRFLDGWKWKKEVIQLNSESSDIALAISVTHDIFDDVENYLTSHKVQVRSIVKLRPESNLGASSITGANHAVCLAELAMQEIVNNKSKLHGLTHIFAAAPNGLIFFLGRYRFALGIIQLYEFDFEGEQGRTYVPSFRLPFSH
ncbi:MAG: SAVED domain-containing protein [Candidatus Jettenia sp.]|nr:MAG: SAVED domain-containing protein [Candidatus Jettenia sp.]